MFTHTAKILKDTQIFWIIFFFLLFVFGKSKKTVRKGKSDWSATMNGFWKSEIIDKR